MRRPGHRCGQAAANRHRHGVGVQLNRYVMGGVRAGQVQGPPAWLGQGSESCTREVEGKCTNVGNHIQRRRGILSKLETIANVRGNRSNARYEWLTEGAGALDEVCGRIV